MYWVSVAVLGWLGYANITVLVKYYKILEYYIKFVYIFKIHLQLLWAPWRKSTHVPCVVTFLVDLNPFPVATAFAWPVRKRPGARVPAVASKDLYAHSAWRSRVWWYVTAVRKTRVTRPKLQWRPACDVRSLCVSSICGHIYSVLLTALTCWWSHWWMYPAAGALPIRRYSGITAWMIGSMSAQTAFWKDGMLNTKSKGWEKWRRNTK